MALLQKSTLLKLPIEVRFMIFEYALEEFKSTEKRRPPTYDELSCCPSPFNFRLQGAGLMAGLACNGDLYGEVLSVYYRKNVFKLTLRNWSIISYRVSTKAIQSVRNLQIQL
jgi:hypothetical protein